MSVFTALMMQNASVQNFDAIMEVKPEYWVNYGVWAAAYTYALALAPISPTPSADAPAGSLFTYISGADSTYDRIDFLGDGSYMPFGDFITNPQQISKTSNKMNLVLGSGASKPTQSVYIGFNYPSEE